jgi:hypothetical protein
VPPEAIIGIRLREEALEVVTTKVVQEANPVERESHTHPTSKVHLVVVRGLRVTLIIKAGPRDLPCSSTLWRNETWFCF